MKTIVWGNSFERDLKRVKKRGYDMGLLIEVIQLLEQEKPLLKRHKDHILVGNWEGRRELHIKPDWLLIYRSTEDEIELQRTGTHADLF